MNAERVADRGLVVLHTEAARLKNFQLVFNKASMQNNEAAHANIEYCPGQEVQGVLYTLTDKDEIHKMDPYERAPWNYGRDAVQVLTGSGTQWAWTYFANAALLVDGRRPPADYMDHLLAGADYLSPEYVSMLRAWPVTWN